MKRLIGIAIATLIIISGWFVCKGSMRKDSIEVTVGQTYVRDRTMSFNKNNPFERVDTVTVEVLEIRGEYLEFLTRHGNVNSSSIKKFKESLYKDEE